MKLYKTLLLSGAFFMAMGGALRPLIAADNELEVKSDKSKNPITGTVTETRKYKKKTKHADGDTSQTTKTEKLKTKTDGSTTKTVEEETEASQK